MLVKFLPILKGSKSKSGVTEGRISFCDGKVNATKHLTR